MVTEDVKDASEKGHWIKDPRERERRYQEARQMLCLHYQARGRRTALLPVLTPPTISRMIADKKVGEANQERLIYLMGVGVSSSIYRGTASLIGQTAGERKDIGDLVGNYTYFRYHSPTSYEKMKLVDGEIEIFIDPKSKDPTFRHRSHNWTQKEWEHTGYVFQTSNRIFMLGRGKALIRLGLGSRMLDYPGVVIDGLVLSLRTASRSPYAARFILVREQPENADLLAELRGEGRKAAFERLTDGHKVWYLHA